MNKQEQIEKWLAGSLVGDELTAFRQTEDYKNLARMDAALQQFKAPSFDADAAFLKIKTEKENSVKVVRLDFSWTTVLKLAAMLVIGLGAAFILNQHFFTDEIKTYTTNAGQTQQIILPDQSIVTLNAKSSMSFNEDVWNKERKLKLDGEAFFQVTKGKTFEVKTSGGTVAVLGTQFNVKQRGGYFEVNCHEGKVEVRAAQKPVILTVNQSYREINKVSSQPALALKATPAWTYNESSFENIPFREALNELERQYDVVITTEGIDTAQKYSGKFPNNDLHTALQSLTLPLGLTYTLDGKVILVKNGV